MVNPLRINCTLLIMMIFEGKKKEKKKKRKIKASNFACPIHLDVRHKMHLDHEKLISWQETSILIVIVVYGIMFVQT